MSIRSAHLIVLFSLTACSGLGGSGSALTVDTTLPDGKATAKYSYTLQVKGGKAPYSWSLKAGALPDGISLGSDGILSGTPKAQGDSHFTVQVKDSASNEKSQALTLKIGPPPFQYVMGDVRYDYSTDPKPAKGASVTDATYHTTITRITDSAQDGAGVWGTLTGGSTWNPLSSDGKYLLLYGLQSLIAPQNYVLYDAATRSFVHNVPLSFFNNQDPEPRWDRTGQNPSRLFYRQDLQLRSYDVQSQATGLVHDFSADFPGYGTGYYITSGAEGGPSSDGRYFPFILRNDTAAALVFVYDLQSDSVVGQKDVTGHSPASVQMSPSGSWVYVAFSKNGSGDPWDGPHAYSRDFTNGVKVCSDIAHLSFAQDKQGHEVAVYLNADYVSFTRLDSGQQYQLYYQGDLGISGTNLLFTYPGPNVPGWSFISTYADVGDNTTNWDHNQIFAFELDETKTYGGQTQPRIWRISFTQNFIGTNSTYEQPNMQMSYDGLHLWFGANWRLEGQPPDVYQIDLPPTWWQDLSQEGP